MTNYVEILLILAYQQNASGDIGRVVLLIRIISDPRSETASRSEAVFIQTHGCCATQLCWELAGLGTLLNCAKTWITPLRWANRGP